MEVRVIFVNELIFVFPYLSDVEDESARVVVRVCERRSVTTGQLSGHGHWSDDAKSGLGQWWRVRQTKRWERLRRLRVRLKTSANKVLIEKGKLSLFDSGVT